MMIMGIVTMTVLVVRLLLELMLMMWRHVGQVYLVGTVQIEGRRRCNLLLLLLMITIIRPSRP